MHLDSDELLARFRRDFPVEYELTVLRAQVDLLTAENDQLRQGATPPGFAGFGRGTEEEVGRHG